MVLPLHLFCNAYNCNTYADDTNLFVSAKTMNELESKANSLLLNLDSWLKANKLHLNIDKTCYSVFSPNKIPVPTVTIKINDIKITCVKECKYLGVIINDELKWVYTSEIKKVTGYIIQNAL